MRRRQEEMRQRRQEEWSKDREEEERLLALTPTELAQRVERSHLASRLGGTNTTEVATAIATLSDDDRLTLALAAHGYGTHDIAHRFFRPQASVVNDLRRIVRRLRGEEREYA
jgi:hypothetical protein